MALNKYLNRLDGVITEFRDISLNQFQKHDGKPANFEDLVWFYIDPNSRRSTRIVTGEHGVTGNRGARIDQKYALPSPYGDLIKVFVIETFTKRISTGEKVARIASARKLISKMPSDLCDVTADSLKGIFKDSRIDRVSHFIQFCERRGLIPEISERLRGDIRERERDRDRTGNAEFAERRLKMAGDEIIKALGVIFSRNFMEMHSLKNEHNIHVRHMVHVFMALLCLAAPNRAAAEIVLITNQRLQSYSEGSRAKVYFLNWTGSKGYKDNKNHILSSLADKVELGLSFFASVCESGRILSRFYKNPKQTLRFLLGDYPIEPKRECRLELDVQAHLFTLGYALGFYGIDDEVFVYWDIDSPKIPKFNRLGWKRKRICDLKLGDNISTNSSKDSAEPGVYKLLNFPIRGIRNAERSIVSIRKVQQLFLELHEKNFPTFPLGFSTGAKGSVQMESALFCVRGSQYFRDLDRGGMHGCRSYYAIVTPRSLAKCAALDARGTLFTENGFPSSYRLNFNQLRHYTNTVASQSGIPNEIITAWSGRKSREQTNVYIHTSHSDRSERVGEVQTVESESVHPIRLISRDKINQELNLPASATSTGVCVQNLISNPCDFLNDFVSSCFLCPNACYIAGDKKALELLDMDWSFQSQRLSAVKKDARLRASEVMQKWFITHTVNTSILFQLITLMREHPGGTVITFNKKNQHFNLVDVKTKAIEHVMCKLPNAKEELRKLLDCMDKDEDNQPEPDTALQNLLESYGIGKVG